MLYKPCKEIDKDRYEIASLLRYFSVLGIPEYLQMEGKLPMRVVPTGTPIHSAW